MFAKTKIFNLMRTLEFGYFLVLISLILLFSIFFIQSTKALFNCALASFIVGSIGWLLVTLDPRDLKEDWEVKELRNVGRRRNVPRNSGSVKRHNVVFRCKTTKQSTDHAEPKVL